MPTKIKVFAFPPAPGYFLDDPTRQPIYVHGANCNSGLWFAVGVLDQYGDEMANQEVTMSTPRGSTIKVLKKENDFFQKDRFFYVPQSNKTIETILFTSGALTASTLIEVADTKSSLTNGSVPFEDGKGRYLGSGWIFDLASLTCISN